MFDGSTILKLELEISAKKIASQIMLDNKHFEESLMSGIQKGFDDVLGDESAFIEMIRQHTKKNILESVNKAVMSWEVQQRIQKGISDAIGRNLESYSENIAKSVLEKFQIN